MFKGEYLNTAGHSYIGHDCTHDYMGGNYMVNVGIPQDHHTITIILYYYINYNYNQS